MFEELRKVSKPPDWLRPAVGFIIDTHIPLATSLCTSLSESYRSKLAPELNFEFPVTLRDNEKDMQKVWDNTNACEGSNLKRLLRKGGPFQSSVRYVQSQLKRGLESKATRSCVATMCRLSFLGAYPHCKIIAPPSRRIDVYKTPDVEILSLCRPVPPAAQVGSHTYFYMIAEYVSSASLASPSIWAHIKKDPKYTAFDDAVRVASDSIRKGKKAPRISSAVSPRVWVPKATVATFLKLVSVRKKLPVTTQKLLDPKLICKLYKSAVTSKVHCVSFLLENVVGSTLASKLAKCKTEAEQKHWLTKLPQKLRAMVQVYCHGLECRSNVQVLPLTEHVAKAQKAAILKSQGRSEYYVTICRSCGTFRNKGVISGVARASIGIKLNLPLTSGDCYSCNGCGKSWGLCRVDLIGSALKIKAKVDADPVIVRMCCGCGFPSESLEYSGLLSYCKTCSTKRKVAYTECYFCKVRKPAVYCKKFDAIWMKKQCTFYSCSTHYPEILGTEGVDINLIMMQQERKHGVKTQHKFYSRTFSSM